MLIRAFLQGNKVSWIILKGIREKRKRHKFNKNCNIKRNNFSVMYLITWSLNPR